MFSDDVPKIEEVPYHTLLLISAGLVFLCQLVAMVLFVGSQVETAESRDARGSSVRMVAADCSENYSGVTRTSCIEQMKAQLDSGSRSIQQAAFEVRR